MTDEADVVWTVGTDSRDDEAEVRRDGAVGAFGVEVPGVGRRPGKRPLLPSAVRTSGWRTTSNDSERIGVRKNFVVRDPSPALAYLWGPSINFALRYLSLSGPVRRVNEVT